mgnify:CR=1 FL=1
MGGAVEKVKEVVRRLKVLYGPISRPVEPDPFKVLVRTILSQNTSYKNELRAFRRLEERVGVEPARLAEADLGAIEECVRPAGQHRQRARRIKEVARIVLERYGGDLGVLLSSGPVETVRAELMALPGVGRKTADIVLLFSARRPVFPVDRHIMRIFSRLGILGPRPGYEAIRAAVEEALSSPEELLFAHLALIRFGREICRAQRPRCDTCPLRDLCGRLGVT